MPRSRMFYICSVIFALYFTHVQLTTAQITAPWEVDALRAIKNSLDDPLGFLDGWNRGDPCVNWTRVICENEIATDGYFHVKELKLLRLNLSGTLSPELGQLSHMKIMDFMWNKIGGSIPAEVGNITSLELLLLNGNLLTGPLPETIGFLPNLNRIQIDQNLISGPIPKSFANLNQTKHFHMNNNSLSGQIPPELSRLPSLVHLLLDNNNLSGYLPPELSQLPKLLIIQLDNNNFSGSSIPSSYGNITTLLKLSLRNCSLEGPAPDVSGIPQLGYLDISWNQLTGPIPSGQLASNITTIDLSHNRLNGTIPGSFSGLPNLQRLSLDNNQLDGSVPSDVWRNINFNGNRSLILDFHNNLLTNLSNPLTPPANVTILLSGNPICTSPNQLNISQYCGSPSPVFPGGGSLDNSTLCSPCSTDLPFESILKSPNQCSCGIPLYVDYRLKSPGFWDFIPYEAQFQEYLSSGLFLSSYQLEVATFEWEEGPRLKMKLKLFPNNTAFFNSGEVLRLRDMFTGWLIADSDIFGPPELIDFIPGWYESYDNGGTSTKRAPKRALLIIAVAAPLLSILLCVVGSIVWMRKRRKGKVNLHDQAATNRPEEDALVWRLEEKSSEFTLFDFSEILHATCNFSNESLLGRGGFGPVYKGQLPGGMEIAVKRLASHSGQGFTEFKNEVELIAKLQHNNLVKLLGCCIQGEEKVLVYEYLPNKSLDFFIFDENRTSSVGWNKRCVIIEGIAQGLLYLHKHSRLRIIHRDLKASNILLDQDMNPKISDFGLAKIFSSNDTQGSTKRVVGTYGYMSPEYASEGIYSVKSDVFSFGVLLLEILSGKRNSGFHQYGDFLNLLGYSWQLWEKGSWIQLLDASITKEIHTTEARRYINIALMCVQESADDRPTMSDVVAMLNSESVVVPEPNHPAYFSLRVSKVHESASVVVPCSNNDVTITTELDGR